MIGEDIRQAINGAEFVLVVEDLFGKGRTLQRLAESAGEVMGPLRASAFGIPLRPGASTWRPQVLGISPRTKADEAEAAADAAEDEGVEEVLVTEEGEAEGARAPLGSKPRGDTLNSLPVSQTLSQTAPASFG